MLVAVAVNWNVIKTAWSQDSDLMEQAAEWGKEDATTPRVDMRGSAYFTIGSPAWEAYNEGYRAGLASNEQLAGASDELAFLNDALDSLRAGACPVCKIWVDRHGRCNCNSADPLAAGERIGQYEYEHRGEW